MYCTKCGKQIDDKAVICVGCGSRVEETKVEKKPSALWWWLGFLIPIVGLIMWGVLRDSEPKKAKLLGMGALIGFITSIVLTVLIYVIYFAIIIFTFLSLSL